MDAEPQVTREQAIAGIQVLLHLIWADRMVTEEEQRALDPTLEALGFDEDEAEALLMEDIELAPALEEVEDTRVRRAVLRAAHALARADGLVPEEVAVIEAARSAWGSELEDPELAADLRRLAREAEVPSFDDPEAQARHLARLVESWVFGVASLALPPETVEARWRGRRTDIGELTRRFMRGEISAQEVSFKFKEDLGEV